MTVATPTSAAYETPSSSKAGVKGLQIRCGGLVVASAFTASSASAMPVLGEDVAHRSGTAGQLGIAFRCGRPGSWLK